MKTTLGKVLSLLLAVMMIFGAAALGITNVGYAECEPPSSFDVWEDEEVPTLNPGNPDRFKCNYFYDVYIPERPPTLLDEEEKLNGDYNEDGYGYNVVDNKAVIVDASVSGDVTIPSSLGGYEVTAIGETAFAQCGYSLTSITIPDGIVSIGRNAFYHCYGLESVTISDSVTSIADGAFKCCHALENIYIPKNVSEIGSNPFIDCVSLTEITVDPENKYYISDENGVLFNKNKTELISYPAGNEITSYTIPDEVTAIHSGAFMSADSLVSVTVPGGITSISNDLFNGCSSLVNVNILTGVTEIGKYGFKGCTSLTNITIPDSVTSIGYHTFENCKSLTSIIIPDSVTSIDTGAFRECSSLKSITISGSVTSIGGYAFYGCNSLTDVYFNGTEAQWKAISIVDYNENLTNATIHYGIYNAIWVVDGKQTTQEVKVGSKITAPATPTKTGYTFKGWSPAVPATMPEKDMTFTAVFEKTVYTVTWVVDGKKTTQKYEYGAKITAPATPTKTGYTFKGWNPAVPATMPAKDMTFTAVFEKTVYTVTWVVDGTKTTHKYEYGAKITPPANPTKSGYTFKGWSPAVPATMPAKNMTFTAVLEKDIYNLGEETYSFGNPGLQEDYYKCEKGKKGHCFAMSVTSSGYYIGELDIASAGAKKGQNLYDLTLTPEVQHPLCFYQARQGIYSINSTVAGGSWYLTDKYNINSDWNEVVNYVKNHEYDGKGTLQIGFRGEQIVGGVIYKGGHAINFLRYEEVNGQPRIYAYDSNFPDTETYFYKDSNGNIKQAPKETFNYSIKCIALRSIPKYFEIVDDYDSANYIYAERDSLSVVGADAYIMEGTVNGVEFVMYELPENAEEVIITPLVDNAEFTYVDESYSFGTVSDDTVGIFTLASDDENGVSNVGLKIVNVGFDIRTPSTTSITYGDSIVLHADVENLPEGAKIVWSADNSNFTYSASADGTTCTVSPSSSGDTTFTASVVDANGNEITKDEQTMTSNAGFFQKIIAFFKGLFGMNKVIPEAFKSIF